jgi:transcriptional regulator with XRE-family HTH domain
MTINIDNARGEVLAPQQLGDAVYTLRMSLGLSRRELVQITGVGHCAIQRIENGLNVSTLNLILVLAGLGYELCVAPHPRNIKARGKLIVRA